VLFFLFFLLLVCHAFQAKGGYLFIKVARTDITFLQVVTALIRLPKKHLGDQTFDAWGDGLI
jgi:hypothetical protein